MRYILRMTTPENRTTRADVLRDLINPSFVELRDNLAELLPKGMVSCIMVRDDGTEVFATHDVTEMIYSRMKEVCS